MKDYVVLSLETYNKLRKESDIYQSIDAYAQNNDMRASTITQEFEELRKKARQR